MYKVLIVEDDPMVAMINEQYVIKNKGFEVVGRCRDGHGALDFVSANHVDLMILDVYMPRMDGFETLRRIRSLNIPLEVIMVTAANGRESLEEALHLGIVDYLVKPFTFERFSAALDKVNVPVTEILAQKLPISIQMGVLAMLLSLVLGIPLGLVMGRYKNRWPDKLGTALIVLIQAVPAAVYFLYIQMYGTTFMGVGLLFDASNWRYWVLPVCSMSLANLAFYAMWLRRYMVDESNKDYVRLARAKGVSEGNIALHHVFRNAMVPLVQYIPSAFLNTVVGSIYIESLYSIPGMGGLLVTCVQRHDNTMVQGIVLLYACVGIIGLILGDVLMVLIDPRINFGKKEGGR